jgi:cephalosporin-C deacetylase
MVRTAPERYVTKVRKPADFDDFWRGLLEQVSRVPLEPEVVQDPLRSSDDVDVYQVFYNSLDGVRIAGWYSVPRGRRRPMPGILHVPGYIMEPPILKDWSRKGYAAFSVAPRGKLRSNAQFNPGYPGLLTYGIVDRNVYTYRGFYVDACRAIDFLTHRPEVDPDRIGVTGHSQGGGLAITTTALCPQVRAASSGAPYLCGFMDSIELTDSYPYHEISDYLRLHPERRKAVEETLAYFDGINFAGRIRCPIIVSIGLQDSTCPPETGYAMFNNIASSDKRLYAYDGHGHDANQHVHNGVIDEFFRKHLKP